MTTEPLIQRLASLSWPKPPLDQPDPKAGQLWRAAWKDVACLVVVLGEVDGRTIRVAGASPELVGDESTVVVTTKESMNLVVWTNLNAAIKVFTLEHRIGDLTTESQEAIDAGINGPRQWAPITNVLDDRSIVRTEVADELNAMREAEWLPLSVAGAPTIRELAVEQGMTASTLAKEIDTSPGRARGLLRGERALTIDEVAKMTVFFGQAPASTPNFDEELVAEMDLPEFRPALDNRAKRTLNGDVVAIRQRFASQQMSVAARHREQGKRNWRALIREALNAD
jgi:plasmid maintenance system antidote protein VapI